MADITPPDYTTPLGQVRLLCTDVSAPYAFSDEAILAFLVLASDNVKRAGAYALDVLASDEALLVKVVRTDDLSVNGAAVADVLRKNAAALRDQANSDDQRELDESFVVVFDQDACWPEGTPIPVYGRMVGIGRCR